MPLITSKLLGGYICSAVVPMTDNHKGFIALGKKYYGPVSTSWCWIVAEPTYLRYVLTHGWRFVIIFIVSGLCIYIQIYLRRHLRSLEPSSGSAYFSQEPHSIQMPEQGEISKKHFPGNTDDDDVEKNISRVNTTESGKGHDIRKLPHLRIWGLYIVLS